jgi:hypothetical protein
VGKPRAEHPASAAAQARRRAPKTLSQRPLADAAVPSGPAPQRRALAGGPRLPVLPRAPSAISSPGGPATPAGGGP